MNSRNLLSAKIIFRILSSFIRIDLILITVFHFLEVATKKNIPPLSGNTLILCATGYEMKSTPMAKSQAGKKVSNALEVGLLMALMCEKASEQATFYCYINEPVLPKRAKSGSLLSQVKSLVSEIYLLFIFLKVNSI